MKKNLFLTCLLIIVLFTITGCSGVKIVKTEASKVTYENYDNGLVSLKIPKGWKVEVAPVDYIHYSFKVYNPEDPNYPDGEYTIRFKQDKLVPIYTKKMVKKGGYEKSVFVTLFFICFL